MRFHDRYYRIARYIFTQKLSPIKDPMHILETRWKKSMPPIGSGRVAKIESHQIDDF